MQKELSIIKEKMNNKKLKEGSIVLRKDGRYMGRYVDDNKRIRYVYALSYKECFDKLKAGIAYRDRYGSDVMFYDFLKDWVEKFKKPNVKPSTLSAIDVCIRVHIKKGMRNKPLRDVGGMELQSFLINIERSRTRKSVYDVLNEAFKKAYALRLIEFNPMLAVEIPAHKQNKGKNLTPDELRKFLLDIEGKNYESVFKFLLYTGCRRGEALNLRFTDIDYENKVLHIPGTKTEFSNRIIPLFDNVAELLWKVPYINEYVFPQYHEDTLTHLFRELVPGHKLHDLRHTFATLCLENRVPLKVVQAWLGHSKLDTTANIYSHVTEKMNREYSNVVCNVFDEKRLTHNLTQNI